MGIIESIKNGKKRIAIRKRWPDGSEIYRFVKNRTIGKALISRIEESITMGTWRELRNELQRGVKKDVTVRQFWERFRDEYCKPRLTDSALHRYELSFKSIKEKVGNVQLCEFTRAHLHGYIQSRKGKVSNSTINKDIAAIKKMFSYAFEVEATTLNPLVRFKVLPVQETALRIITRAEFERLIDAMPTPEMSAFVAVTGETGMRKSEALNLKWEDIDFPRKRIVIERTKGKRVRYVPLSDKAIQKILELSRYIGVEKIFVRDSGSHKGQSIKNPYRQFCAGRKAAGLEWVTIHGLRHYRATSWIQYGAEPRSVQEKLGHKAIQTTMRYVHYVETHGDRAIREAQEREMEVRNDNDLKRVKNGG